MKKILLLSFIAAIYCNNVKIAAQSVIGDGPIVSENVNLSQVTKIGIGISADVFLTQGNNQSIEIKGQKNIIDILNKEVNEKSWEIKTKDNKKIRNYKKIEIYITIADVEALSIGGSGSFIGKGKFNVDDLAISIGGSGNVTLDLDADDIRCSIGGSGNVNLKGNANKLEADIGGSGSVKAIDLKVENCTVNTAGSGSVQIHATSNLKANVVGSGGVLYKGSPKIKSNIVGSGKVKAF